MKKGIIFDFDGVIIDSIDNQRQALVESYKLVVGEGRPPFDEFLSHNGDSLGNIFLKMKLPLAMVEHYRKFSSEKIESINIYNGMRDLLKQLTDDGYNCALCTGKDRKRTLEILDKLMLNEYFEAVVCSDDVSKPKPYPDSLILAIEKLGIGPDNAVMVGDAKNDILCAINTGVRVIAVSWGGIAKEILERESPDRIVNTVEELSAAIRELIGSSMAR